MSVLERSRGSITCRFMFRRTSTPATSPSPSASSASVSSRCPPPTDVPAARSRCLSGGSASRPTTLARRSPRRCSATPCAFCGAWMLMRYVAGVRADAPASDGLRYCERRPSSSLLISRGSPCTRIYKHMRIQ